MDTGGLSPPHAWSSLGAGSLEGAACFFLFFLPTWRPPFQPDMRAQFLILVERMPTAWAPAGPTAHGFGIGPKKSSPCPHPGWGWGVVAALGSRAGDTPTLTRAFPVAALLGLQAHLPVNLAPAWLPPTVPCLGFPMVWVRTSSVSHPSVPCGSCAVADESQDPALSRPGGAAPLGLHRLGRSPVWVCTALPEPSVPLCLQARPGVSLTLNTPCCEAGWPGPLGCGGGAHHAWRRCCWSLSVMRSMGGWVLSAGNTATRGIQTASVCAVRGHCGQVCSGLSGPPCAHPKDVLSLQVRLWASPALL